MPFLGEGGCDLLLHALVVGEQLFQPVPHAERFFRPLRTLIDPAERLKNVEEVGAVRLARQGPFERFGRSIGLADEHERLAKIVRSDGIVRLLRLGLAEGGHRIGVAATLRLHQTDDHPRHAVLSVLLRPRRVCLDEFVEAAALDMVTVDAIQGGPTPRIFLQHADEALDDQFLALLLRREWRRLRGGLGATRYRQQFSRRG